MSELPPETETTESVDPQKLLAALDRFKRVVFLQEEPLPESVEDARDGGDDTPILRLV